MASSPHQKKEEDIKSLQNIAIYSYSNEGEDSGNSVRKKSVWRSDAPVKRNVPQAQLMQSLINTTEMFSVRK